MMEQNSSDVFVEPLDWQQFSDIPPNTRLTLENYYINRWDPGGFVTAVLSNDLMSAAARADAHNARALVSICRFVQNRLPRECWGSYQAVAHWLLHGNNQGGIQ